jgi:Cytochrome c7 and related cytochrome c
MLTASSWGCALVFSVLSAFLSDEKPAPPQPIPFSHKTHAVLGVKCLYCHPIKDPGFAAGLPDDALCMSCHETIKTESAAIQKLAQQAKSGIAIEGMRIYTVPDYVWFSHKSHHRGAGLECETCHGPVAEREVIVKEKPTSMTACMDCHAKRRASNDCGFCHNPM